MAEAVASWPWLWPPAVPVFFLLWISCSSSLCPLAKQSFENSHLSGSTFLKPCSTQLDNSLRLCLEATYLAACVFPSCVEGQGASHRCSAAAQNC